MGFGGGLRSWFSGFVAASVRRVAGLKEAVFSGQYVWESGAFSSQVWRLDVL